MTDNPFYKVLFKNEISLRQEYAVRCLSDPVAAKQATLQHVFYSQGLYTFQMISPGLLVKRK